MMAIMVVRPVVLEDDSVEEDIEANLVADAVDAEDKVFKAEVVAVARDKEDITETKGITLTLNFDAYQKILN